MKRNILLITIDMVTTIASNNWDGQKNIAKSKKMHTYIQLLPASINTLIVN